MKRRRALRSATVVIAGLAGCSQNQFRNRTNRSSTRPSAATTTSGTTAKPTRSSGTTTTTTPRRTTPPPDFTQEWSFDGEENWMEHSRYTEYPQTHYAYNWNPKFARTAQYSHVSSQAELASALDASGVPPIVCAGLSKWALPTEFPGSRDKPGNLVADVRNWFKTWFEGCTVDVGDPKYVEPFVQKLNSGTKVGWYPHEAKGDTGQLQTPFRAIVDGGSIEVTRVTYEAEAVLIGLPGPELRVGFLAGGGWPKEDAVALHTAENGTIDVSVSVSGESWGIEDRLFDVLNEIDTMEVINPDSLLST